MMGRSESVLGNVKTKTKINATNGKATNIVDNTPNTIALNLDF